MGFILDLSLVLYLPFYQMDGPSFGSGDVHGHPGTVTGAFWRPCGRYFDGVDDIATLGQPAALNFGTGNFTLLAWIKTASSTDYPRIVRRRLTAGVDWFLHDTDGIPRLILHDGVNVYANTGDARTAVADNVWHGLAVAVNRDTKYAHFYVDGKSDGTGDISAVSGSVDADVDFTIGARAAGDAAFSGVIGEISAYNRVLAPQEVLRHYLVTKGRYQ